MAYIDKLENIIIVAGGLVHAVDILDGWNGYKVTSDGLIVMNADVSFSATGTLYDDTVYKYFYSAELDTISNNAHVFFHGVELPQAQTATKCIVTATYDLATTSWVVNFDFDSISDFIIETNNITDKSVTLNKLQDLSNANILIGNSSNRPIAVAISGDVAIDNTGATTITSAAITNTKVAPWAQIEISKLAAGTNGQIPISNSDVPTWTTLSGDVTVDETGVTTVNPAILNTIWTNGVGGESAILVANGVENTAAGNYAVASGELSQADGDCSVAMGFNVVATGQGAVAMGIGTKATNNDATAFGNLTRATKEASTSLGNLTNNTRYSQLSVASNNPNGSPSDNVYSQLSQLSQIVTTTDATVTTIGMGGISNKSLDIDNNSLVLFQCTVTAVQKSGSSGSVGDSKTWMFNGLIQNISTTVSIKGDVLYLDGAGAYQTTVTERTGDMAASAWTVLTGADNTNKSLNIVVTGEANKNIVWTATYILNETKYA